MNKLDLQRLLAVEGYPAISILLPTHRRHPDNKQDPIRVRNLVERASNMLLASFSRRDASLLLEKVEELTAKIDYRYTLDGLAIFVHKDYAGVLYLPFPVDERVMLDQRFAIRDLVFALNRSPRYWVLVLSEKPTRLYLGYRGDLEEVTDGEFPMVHLGPGGAESLPGGFGIKRSAIRDEYDRKFFRHVDEAFTQFASADPLPLVLVGVDRNIAFFMEITSNKHSVVDVLKGSHDATSIADLAELVWPLVEAALARKRREALQELEVAISQQKYASGISSVWSSAKQGRGELLLVEQNFYTPARLDTSGFVLTPVDHPEGDGNINDAVDELIEIVMAKQGRVVFMDDGMLDNHGRVAMVLRY